jgi:hypothetical protein
MSNGMSIPNQLRTDYILAPSQAAVQAPFNALKKQEVQQSLDIGQQDIGMNELKMQKLQQELDSYKFQDDDDAIEWWNEVKGMVNLGNYDSMKQAAVMKGANPELFPDVSTFGGVEQNLQDWIYQADQQLAKIKATPKEPKEPRTMKTWVLPDGTTTNLPDNKPPPKGAVPYKAKTEKTVRETPEEAAAKAAAKAEATAKAKDTPKARQATIKKEFKDKLDKARSAQRGVGQFIQDENKTAVQMAYMREAANAMERYIEAGGDPRDLNINPEDFAEFLYNSPEEVVEDIRNGTITREEGKRILKKLFPNVGQ